MGKTLKDQLDSGQIGAWFDDTRYETLRTAAIQLWQSNREHVQSQFYWLYCGDDKQTTQPIRPITIQRFCEAGRTSQDIRTNRLALATMLMACARVVRKKSSSHDNTSQDIISLLNLADEFSREFTLHLDDVAEPFQTHGEYTRPQLELISRKIRHRAGDDPHYPEYPALNRRFPASNSYLIDLGERQILLKDESSRGTGTHKDRMAWEIIVQYKKTYIAEALNKGIACRLPRCSIISSGSAAIALQMQLDRYGLPNLHVLMDEQRARPEMIELLESWGAKVFKTNLEEKELQEQEVLELTQNIGGIDLTARDIKTLQSRTYYDWLTFEILNLAPKHIFVPFGTGELFCNVITVIGERLYDKRLLIDLPKIDGVAVYGAMSSDSRSRFDMLYAKHRPMQKQIEGKLKEFKARGALGPASGFFEVKEPFAKRAVSQIAEYNPSGARFDPSFSMRGDLSGLSGLGLFLEIQERIPTGETVVVVNTGSVDVAP